MRTLRDYQIPAVQKLVSTRRGIIQSPAGSGKTIIGAAAAAEWLGPRARFARRKMRVAWVANTTEQCGQAKFALDDFETITIDADVTICCYQSGMSLAPFDLVIFDECHHVAAPEFSKMVNYHDGWRWGLSATPNRADDLKENVFNLIGPIIHIIDRTALVEAGQLSKARVIIHQPNTPNEYERDILALAIPEFDRRMKRFRVYGKQAEQEQKARCIWQFANDIGIFQNPKRNDTIVKTALQHATDHTLIIIGKIEHGEQLAEQIPGSLVVHSKIGARRRREAIAAFGAGDLHCMIATSLADEGLDVPRANALILAAGGRSARTAEQRTGRVLRTFHDKTHGTIHDFNDVQHMFLKAQSQARIRLYRSLGYDVTFANEGGLL